MEPEQVRSAIHALMERKDNRVEQLQRENRSEFSANKRMQNEVTILNLQHSIDTLIELEHILRLCDCPEVAYQQKAEG